MDTFIGGLIGGGIGLVLVLVTNAHKKKKQQESIARFEALPQETLNEILTFIRNGDRAGAAAMVCLETKFSVDDSMTLVKSLEEKTGVSNA